MAKFISRYASHRLGSPYGVIEFERNICVLDDEEKADYLREHPDFGVFIFEEEGDGGGAVCPNCGRGFKNQQGLAAHLRSCGRKNPEGQPVEGQPEE